MLTSYHLAALATSFSLISVLHASPATAATSNTPVLWTWAKDPINCKTTACTTDCQTATARICQNTNLTQSLNETVGDCTALYWYDAGDTIPTEAQCNAAFGKVTGPAIKRGSPADCTGYVGGALGYNSSNDRTNDPLYLVYPSTGNGNCLKAPGDTSPVLGLDELPSTSPGIQPATLNRTCPAVATSRRRRTLVELENREVSSTDTRCGVEGMLYGASCSSYCVLEVTAGGWETGPFVAVGWLACTGACTAAAIKSLKTCEKSADNSSPPGKRAEFLSPVNPCVEIGTWEWPCAEVENQVLDYHHCTDVAGSSGGTTGEATINT